MQVNKIDYDPKKHDAIRTICVKQPFAQAMAEGEITIEVRSENTSYRGDVMICSKPTPVFPHLQSGAMLGYVEIYKTKPVRLFTKRDWTQTRIPIDKRKQIKEGWGWFLKNPRKVIELPVHCRLDLDVIYFTKNTITFYPTEIKITAKDRELIKEQDAR